MAEADRSTILILGELPKDVFEGVQNRVRAAMKPIQSDALGPDLQRARVLLIGEGVPSDSLELMIPVIRETAPWVALFSVRHAATEGAALPVGIVPDASFQLPDDQTSLNTAIQEALAPGRFLTTRKAAARNAMGAFFGLSVLVITWTLVTRGGLLPPFLLPSPERVVGAFLETPLWFFHHMLITAAEAGGGFILGNAFGALVAVFLYWSGAVRRASLPIITGLQALPIVALAPLISVWLGSGPASKVAMAAVVCLFPVISNMLAGFDAVDRDLRQLFIFHRASYRKTLFHLLIPATVPVLIAGLRTSGSLAVVGAIVAEFTGADGGLGYLILNASYRLETDKLFVAILLSMLLGIVFAGVPSVLHLNAAGRGAGTK